MKACIVFEIRAFVDASSCRYVLCLFSTTQNNRNFHPSNHLQEDSPVQEGLLSRKTLLSRKVSSFIIIIHKKKLLHRYYPLLLQSGKRKHGNRVCHRELKNCRSQHPKPACIVLQIRIFSSLTDAWIPLSHFGFRHGQKETCGALGECDGAETFQSRRLGPLQYLAPAPSQPQRP